MTKHLIRLSVVLAAGVMMGLQTLAESDWTEVHRSRVLPALEKSVHPAVDCADCHGSHDIRPKTDPLSRTYALNIPLVCAQCHGAKGGGQSSKAVKTVENYLSTYRDNFHGNVTQLGYSFTAKCADCHTPHSILAASDTRSAVHPDRLVETCGKCHEGSNASFVKFDPHANPTDRKRSPVLYWSWVVMTTLLVGTFAFFGLHTVLWVLREAIEKRRESRGDRP